MKGRRLKWCCFIHRGNSLNCWAFQNLPSNVLLPKNNQTWTYFIGKQICSLSFQKKKDQILVSKQTRNIIFKSILFIKRGDLKWCVLNNHVILYFISICALNERKIIIDSSSWPLNLTITSDYKFPCCLFDVSSIAAK